MLYFFVSNMIDQCRTWAESERTRLVRLFNAYLLSHLKDNLLLVSPEIYKNLESHLLEFDDKKLKKCLDRKRVEHAQFFTQPAPKKP